ncbi:thioredoxin domain-containing protein [Carboxylicivirga caseinilyticus]|uniref:thioredoxin domain-containing protein n=1 Tax=Carboxylicivirga caseinilyticus TaxID=3417572 RepID=UPI003D35227C|nr:thioredoxin domain-containing protein [Marinilabiliaceae bacterium A049]
MRNNKLIHETSPYLLQHAHNPVDWYPWSDEAFAKARKEDKLILISIGYSACHWCHVMEHESFEDEAVAALMNKHFICIKVDREERPDVDHIYMEAVQMISGRGGWPLNCFALPDGKPVWGGTYFPQEQWKQVLSTLSNIYQNERPKVLDQAKHLTEGIQQQDFPELSILPKTADEETIIKNLNAHFDSINGGFGSAPKFPMPVALNLALQWGYLNNNNNLPGFSFLTLDKMANGGIYDQVGGGFARYSVDEHWFAPHFEKMLYDNAQLVSLYSIAYQITRNEDYKRIVSETIAFTLRELTSPEGAFYSALDADSEGVEGKFYIWRYNELKTIIGEDEHFYKYFNIRLNGNWEDGLNILHSSINRKNYAKNEDIDPLKFEEDLQRKLELLLQQRSSRIRPGLDDKILTAWNSLMISALCEAYKALGREDYLQSTEKALNYLLNVTLQKDGSLHRTSKNGISKITGFLDDYAFLIQALINTYQVTFNEKYIQQALSLCQYVMDHFYNDANGIFYYTSSKGETLVARKTEIQDNVIPSSVGTMVQNLIHLSQLMHLPEYETIAEMLISKLYEQAEKNPVYYAQWALLSLLQNKRQEIVICGEKADEYRKEIQKTFRVGTIYAGTNQPETHLDLLNQRYQEDKTLIYKCENKVCNLPTSDVNSV